MPGACQDFELVTQRENLKLQRGPRLDRCTQGPENGKHDSHHARRLPSKGDNINRNNENEVSAMHIQKGREQTAEPPPPCDNPSIALPQIALRWGLASK